MKATLTPINEIRPPQTTVIHNQEGEIIVLREKNTTHFVEINNITHLSCDCYITSIFTNDGEKVIVAKLLKDFEIELDKYGFIRTNRNMIINYTYIKGYERGGNRMVYLRNGTSLKASRRGITKLKNLLEK